MSGKYLAAGSCRGQRGEFFGFDAGGLGGGGKVAAALSVIVSAAVSGVFLVAFAPGLWWVFTIYGWVVFPAFGLLARGVSEVSEAAPGRAVEGAPGVSQEGELLEALRRHGELTAARAAMETSLSVAGADKMLGELAKDGHLEVRARDGGVFYALWGVESR